VTPPMPGEGRPAFDVEKRGLRRGVPIDPCVVVVFGASGDLARRELMPALFELFRQRLLPDAFAVVGVSPSGWTSERFREEMRAAVLPRVSADDATWSDFAGRLTFVRGDAAAPPGEAYAALARAIAEARAAFGIADNVLFHLAVPPALFGTIVGRLGASGLAASEGGWRRVVVEKPFGRDRASARVLDDELRSVFGEEQIYRVDHFLGKETVQNMLVFRFANPSFEPVWNRNYIDHVQITVAEELGIGTRAAFYEQTGVVRDMVQNHLLQLLCMTATEPPVSFDADSLRDETAKVLESVQVVPIDVEDGAVHGQYSAGGVGDDRVRGYREEDGVPADSTTGTYAALKVTLDSWRWAGVPFYLRTGKRMRRKLSEVAIHFRPTPHFMFSTEVGRPHHQSVLAFELQPNEGIVQTLVAKRPGPELALCGVTMNFDYAGAFGVEEPPSAYAWLLLDAMQGDQTLFARADWIDRAWQIVDPIVQRWDAAPADALHAYPAGSDGPTAADRLMERDGRSWRPL
jgi:glucose-6-phosphate 1-dehydrogenase